MKPGDAFNPWRGECGFYPPDVIGRHRSLTDGQKRLYERLVRYAGRNGHSYPSQVQLAADLGKSDRQIRRDLTRLEELRFIQHRFRERRRSNAYVFLWHRTFEDSGNNTSASAAGDDLSGHPRPVNTHSERTSTSGQTEEPSEFERTSTSGLSGHPRPTNSVQEIHTHTREDSGPWRERSAASEPTVSAPPPKTPSAGNVLGVPHTIPARDGFEEFQSQYPAPKSGMYVESACRAYVGRIHGTPGEHERLMEGLARYRASADWQRWLSSGEGRFIPSMEKFISEGRYLDHPPAADEEPGDDWHVIDSEEAMAEFRRKELAVG